MAEEEYTPIKKYQLSWDGIIRNANIEEKQERFKNYVKTFKTYLHDEIKAQNKNKKISDEDSILVFIDKNKVLPTLASYVLKSQINKATFIETTAYFLRMLKYNEYLMTDDKLNKELFKVILNLSQDLDNTGKDFIFRNEYCFLLNCVTRLILNYPKLISYYKIKKY